MEGSGAHLPGIRISSLPWVLVQLALVLFSSTAIAGEASEYAFQFYRVTTGLTGGLGLHLVAQKGVHFALFFALGVALYCTLVAPRRVKVLWVLAACLVAGFASEGFQFFFPSRHPSLGDVVLNGISGLLGAALLSMMKPTTETAS